MFSSTNAPLAARSGQRGNGLSQIVVPRAPERFEVATKSVWAEFGPRTQRSQTTSVGSRDLQATLVHEQVGVAQAVDCELSERQSGAAHGLDAVLVVAACDVVALDVPGFDHEVVRDRSAVLHLDPVGSPRVDLDAPDTARAVLVEPNRVFDGTSASSP